MTNAPDEVLPQGVDLISWDDYPKRRKMIFDSVKDSMQKQFPMSYGGVRMELENVHYADDKEFTPDDYKKALLGNQFLHWRLRGTMRLLDEKTGQKLDEKETTLLRVPYLTDHGTFVHNGNDYSTLSQARLMPGVYTRRKANGELESHFNAKRGTGSSFRVRLEPESGMFKLDIGQSSLRLYSLLKDLGIPDDHLQERWGPELLQTNREGYDPRVFDKAYNRLVRRPDPNATREQKAAAIKAALSETKLSREVVSRTLPNLFNTKVATVWRQQGLLEPLPQAPEPPTELSKADMLLLADMLNQKFHAGIPLDVPTQVLVEEIMNELHEIMPGVNEEMLADSINEQKKEAGVGAKGCLMANLTPEDSASIVAWAQENIPAKHLTLDGIEHETHVTVRYGWKPGVDMGKLKRFLKDYPPIRLTLGKVKRFENVNQGTADALVVEVNSPDLLAMNKAIEKEFADDLHPNNYKYNPHMTLGYVTPGTVRTLNGHSKFEGATYVIPAVVFSEAGSKKKTRVVLDTTPGMK